MLTDSVDAIALVGHMASELSALRREHFKPSLRPEFHAIGANNTPHLFGDDLAKQIRDAKETNRLGKTSSLKPFTRYARTTLLQPRISYLGTAWQNKFVMPKRRNAFAKPSPVHPNSLTTIKATGDTAHGQTKHQRNTTKVAHGRIFWGKTSARRGKRNPTKTGPRQARNNCLTNQI